MSREGQADRSQLAAVHLAVWAGAARRLTRQLVQAQQGSVGPRSRLGQSSVFHLVLNRVHGTDAARGSDMRA